MKHSKFTDNLNNNINTIILIILIYNNIKTHKPLCHVKTECVYVTSSAKKFSDRMLQSYSCGLISSQIG